MAYTTRLTATVDAPVEVAEVVGGRRGVSEVIPHVLKREFVMILVAGFTFKKIGIEPDAGSHKAQ